jgi:hypothetical protein
MSSTLLRTADRSAAPASGAAAASWFDDPYRARAALVFLGGAFMVLAQSVIPMDEFVHRGDDAFYYFKIALDYPELGFWSFDGLHATNGVQPLWAVLLTVVAQIFAWVGITDPHVMARVFVAFTGLVHLASAIVLFNVLARQVSPGTGLAAAGALLFPLGFLWGRVWGMESVLYTLMLVATAGFFHFVFRRRESVAAAAGLGLLLGLTALARLNAGLLIPCVLLFYLLVGGGGFVQRVRLAFVVGSVATAVLMPYFLWNLLGTGHLLPVSGSVKAVGIAELMEERGISSRFSRDYLSFIYWRWRTIPGTLFSTRSLDGMWVLGVRTVYDNYGTWAVTTGILAGLATAPALLGARAWLRLLRDRLALLAPFIFVLAFAVVDFIVSIWLYPTQRYAIVRWWIVPQDLVIITLVATLSAAAVSHVGTRLVPAAARGRVATVLIALLVAVHAAQMVRFHWDGERHIRNWNLSWNDDAYLAAAWINENLPEDALIGSWNAGVLGYYTERPVINLDGLINDFELYEYIRDGRIVDYIRDKRIQYVADMYLEETGVLEVMEHEEVYSRHSEFMRRPYRIVRMLE